MSSEDTVTVRGVLRGARFANVFRLALVWLSGEMSRGPDTKRAFDNLARTVDGERVNDGIPSIYEGTE